MHILRRTNGRDPFCMCQVHDTRQERHTVMSFLTELDFFSRFRPGTNVPGYCYSVPPGLSKQLLLLLTPDSRLQTPDFLLRRGRDYHLVGV